MSPQDHQEKVILVVGSCGVDRLLTVPTFPGEDAKVRTTSFCEMGGGNAANTAAAIGRLAHAQCFKNSTGTSIKVQYLGKVGADAMGDYVLQELKDSNVDLSSPLCLRGEEGSTTSVTTIVVTEDTHTRTCLHTPGTCGQLQVHDIFACDLDVVFQNVVHLHTDTRHTDASLFLMKQARLRRGTDITISCDCEKDRHSKALDELVQLCDWVFTNEHYLKDYLERWNLEMEEDHEVAPLPTPHINDLTNGLFSSRSLQVLSQSFTPSAFLTRWFPRTGRHVIVTRGAQGALHFQTNSIQSEFWNGQEGSFHFNNIDITTLAGTASQVCLHHRFSRTPTDDLGFDKAVFQEAVYTIHTVGVWNELNSIVDSTGAGDAFIGGYLLAKLGIQVPEPSEPILLAMQFATWVAGHKLQGPGARSALPDGSCVDQELGTKWPEVISSLDEKVSPFNSGYIDGGEQSNESAETRNRNSAHVAKDK